MASTAVRLACIAALVVAVGGAFAPGGAVAATPPAIELTVDGATLADGDSTLVKTDPTVRVAVDADRSIRVVSIRVDGTTVRRETPNATTFDDRLDLDLASGEHTLTVVVETDGVVTHEVTVTKDAERPYVRYTAPFETDRYAPPPESASVNRSRLVLAGNFTDVTGVSHLRINRTTTYEVGSATRTDTEVYTAADLNGSFAQPIFLGVGDNQITARYYDRLGHVRVHRFRIVVEDTAPPTLANLSAIRQSPSTLRIGGTATDNGQIRSVSIRPANEPGMTYPVDPGSGRPDRTRGRVTFGTNRTLYPGSTAVVVEATDTAGNAVERTVTVRRTVAPELRIDPTATRFVRDGTVAVRGRATDGEIVSASVETVDPATGEVIDIATLHDDGIVTDLPFDRRLDALDRRTTIRLRVIDSSGTEHVRSVDRAPTVETPTSTATPTPTPATPTATPVDPSPTPVPTSVPTPEPAPAGVRIPLIGVTVPIPSVLGASVSVPVPLLGPFDVPVVPVAGLVALGLGAVARAR